MQRSPLFLLLASLLLYKTSGKCQNLGLIAGLVIGVPAAIAILFLLVWKFLQKYHPAYLPRRGCGWIPCWRRQHNGEPSYVEEELIMGSSHLTEEQVQQCKDDLKEYYYRLSLRRGRVDQFNFMERVNLDDIYTNLSGIDESGIHKTLTYEDLFDESGNLSKRLLIQGEGGVGKTTLCAKIAWDWCKGRILQDLDMVLVIPLRVVTDGKTIGGIVERYFCDLNAVTPNQIDGYISRNSSKVLFVFDGFDEFNGEIEGRSSSEIIRIIGSEQYTSCKLIVTTRPWRWQEFRMGRSLDEDYTFISLEGFNQEYLSTYIKRYFRIKEKDVLSETLLSFIQDNDVIRSHMTPYPIYCAALCLMWHEVNKEKREEIQKMQTISKIFGEMITFLKERYALIVCFQSFNQLIAPILSHADRAVQEISQTALHSLWNRKLSFPEEKFNDCRHAMETCRRIGILTIEVDITSHVASHASRKLRGNADMNASDVSAVSFPHKLFQEYLAGVYLENLFANDRVKYDRQKNELLRRREEFRYLLYFASALKKELGLDIIGGLIKCADRDFCVDVAFECHTMEAARAVGERWTDYTISSKMSEHTKSGVVFMVHCNQARSLSLKNVNCGRTVSRGLAEGMFSGDVLRKVSISNTQLHVDFYKLVGEEASHSQIQDLELSFDSWDDRSSVGGDLAQWVCTMTHLWTFNMTCSYLPDDFLSTAVALAPTCQIRKIVMEFRGRQVSEKTAANLAEFLCSLPHLANANLKSDDLPEIFVTTIASQATSRKNMEGIIINGMQPIELVSNIQGDTTKRNSSSMQPRMLEKRSGNACSSGQEG